MGHHPNQQSKVSDNKNTLPAREAVTEHQLAMLLGVTNHLSPYLLSGGLRDFQEPPKLDGGVASSASLTFINACSRIDEILADKTRWDTSAHDALYSQIEQVQAAQIHFLHEQAESARSVRRPSFQMRPTLAHDGKKFYALFGDITRAGYYIVGIGDTANAALADFDAAFDRASSAQITLAVQSESPPPTPKPKRKK
jgi:hypothetical protein